MRPTMFLLRGKDGRVKQIVTTDVNNAPLDAPWLESLSRGVKSGKSVISLHVLDDYDVVVV